MSIFSDLSGKIFGAAGIDTPEQQLLKLRAQKIAQQQLANQPNPWDTFGYGTPAEQLGSTDYNWGLGPGQITRGGQPLTTPAPPPGAIPALDRGIAAARANQGSNVADYTSGLTSGLNDYKTLINNNNAFLDQTYGDLKSTLSGINQAPWEAASSNPADIARQQASYDALSGVGNGSLDVTTNPEDLQRQKQAADKLWGLTDPQMTAEERFMEEQFRVQEEQDRRAAMDAALRDLAQRGMLGSGHEIGAMLGGQQITSSNRMLQDLGAQANAVGRATSALGKFTDLSTNMRNASDAVSSGNSNRRLGGMEGASSAANSMRDASDVMARANQASKQQHDQFGVSTDLSKAGTLAGTGVTIAGQKAGNAGAVADRTASTLGNAFGATSGLNNADAAIATQNYDRLAQQVKDRIQAEKDRQAALLASKQGF